MSASSGYEKKVFLRRALVRIKYLSPLTVALFCLILCALPVCRFDVGFDLRRAQSVFNIASESGKRSAATLSASESTDVDVALAGRLRPLPAVTAVIFAVSLIGAAVLAGASVYAFSLPPDSDRCNLFKVRFRFFFPGRWLHFLLLILPAIPTAIPYYVASSFTEYYRVRGVTETATGAQMPEYYTYSVCFAGVNPLIAAGVAVVLSVVLFIAVSGWERAYRLDLFTEFEKEKNSDSARKRRTSGQSGEDS